MYINGGTIIVCNNLKIGGIIEGKKEILPQFPMPFYPPPSPQKGSSISLLTNDGLSYGIQWGVGKGAAGARIRESIDFKKWDGECYRE